MPETPVAPALGVSIKTQPNEGREIVFQTHVAQAIPSADLNTLIDKLIAASDRQSAKANLVTLRRDLTVHEKQLRQMEEDFTNIEGNAIALWKANNRKGEYKPQPRDAAQKQTAEGNIKRWREQIDLLKKTIAEFEEKAK